MKYLRKEELAVMAGVTTRTIENEMARGHLTPTRLGRSVRFDEAQVCDWLARCRG
jgi:excisionase family DNA binding protein